MESAVFIAIVWIIILVVFFAMINEGNKLKKENNELVRQLLREFRAQNTFKQDDASKKHIRIYSKYGKRVYSGELIKMEKDRFILYRDQDGNIQNVRWGEIENYE